MGKDNNGFTQKTIDAWQPGYKRKLTPEDARQITENMTGFFNTLMEWESKEKAGQPSELGVNLTLKSREPQP